MHPELPSKLLLLKTNHGSEPCIQQHCGVIRIHCVFLSTHTRYLFVPLQQDGATVFRRPLEALVDVLHQQVHAVLIQRLHTLLDVACLEGTEHFQHQALGTVLHKHQHQHLASPVTTCTHQKGATVATCNKHVAGKVKRRMSGVTPESPHLDVLILGVDWWVFQHRLQCLHEVPFTDRS